MAKTTLRPTVPADLPHVIGEPLPCRIQALTVLDGERVLGIGGLAFARSGPPWAFVQQAPDARRYPVAFHRAGLAAMEMILKSGAPEVLATADPDSPPALRWLARLGFVPADMQTIPGKRLFVWRRPPAGP